MELTISSPQSPYFSRSYSLAIKSLQLQAWTILPMVKNGIERYRDWIQRYFGRIDATGARDVEIDEDCQQKQESTPQWMQVGVKKIIDSPLIAGLPPKDGKCRRIQINMQMMTDAFGRYRTADGDDAPRQRHTQYD